MTIAAGFVCIDGVLICGDTEHTSNAKFNQTKLKKFNSEFVGTYSVVGAGSTSYVGMMCDLIEEGVYENRELFSTCDPKETMNLFRGIVREKTKAVHQHIAGYPYDGQKPDVELIIGVHSKADEPSLLHVGSDGGVYTIEGGPVFIGAGAQVALAFSRIVLINEDLPIEMMRWVAIFLLYQAKQSAPFCGGDTQLDTLPTQPFANVYNEQKMSEQVERAMRLTLLKSRNMKIPDEVYENKIDAFAKELREIRQNVQNHRWTENFFMEEIKKLKQESAAKK
jgi:20S proteasome alpha/beta subunit